MYSQYEASHYIKDLDSCICYIKANYKAISTHKLHQCPISWYFCNMFAMKRELFFEYCEWLFDVLFNAEICYKDYDIYQARVFGFLSERLFNCWLWHKQSTNPHLKIKTLPAVFFYFEPKNKWLSLCYKALKKIL